MRLIDADELRKTICKGFTSSKTKPDENPMVDLCECLVDFISIIDEQPTAYDVDKVVEQLGVGLANECVYKRDQKTYTEAIRCAIEIVKGGGVNA